MASYSSYQNTLLGPVIELNAVLRWECHCEVAVRKPTHTEHKGSDWHTLIWIIRTKTPFLNAHEISDTKNPIILVRITSSLRSKYSICSVISFFQGHYYCVILWFKCRISIKHVFSLLHKPLLSLALSNWSVNTSITCGLPKEIRPVWRYLT
jgi:hypothetical protein